MTYNKVLYKFICLLTCTLHAPITTSMSLAEKLSLKQHITI